MTAPILVCDDDELLREAICIQLEAAGYGYREAGDGDAALKIAQGTELSGAVLDVRLPGMSGLECLRRLKAREPALPVLVVTAHGDLDSALEATTLGAFAYLSKPLSFDELLIQLGRAIEDSRLKQEVETLRRGDHPGYADLIGTAPQMEALFEQLRRLESVPCPTVLIHGESGTGKELVAKAIHTKSRRRQAPFVVVDCTSLPEQLVESELFGHKKGSFTDARSDKVGLLEAAGKGTVFFDEIAELPLGMQSKLLRCLENRSFKPVGGVTAKPFEAAVVAASHRHLPDEVAAGRFREDLYFRLSVLPVSVPPLRDRLADLHSLSTWFVQRIAQEVGQPTRAVSSDAVACLGGYTWPGNVRELKNVLARVVIFAGGEELIASQLPPEIRFPAAADRTTSAAPVPTTAGPAVVAEATSGGDLAFRLPPQGIDLEAVEREFVRQAIEASRGQRTEAAKLLGLTRHSLRYRLKKFGLEDIGAA